MGRNATRTQQVKARVREARLVLLSQRKEQDQRIEDATVRAVLAWQGVAAVQSRLDAAERHVGEALVSLDREKVTMTDMVALTGITRPQCARLLKLASTTGDAETIPASVESLTVPDAAR